MIPIRINLLPHRELKRARQARQFAVMAAAALVLGAAVVVLGNMAIANATDNQTRRNEFLRLEIAKLDQQLAEIKKLKEKTQALLSRKDVVESLQGQRVVPVHLMDEMARRLPEGVILRAVRQSEETLSIQGVTQSSALVSSYMRNLEASPWFETPNLIEVKAASQDSLRTNEFSLTVKISGPHDQGDRRRPES